MHLATAILALALLRVPVTGLPIEDPISPPIPVGDTSNSLSVPIIIQFPPPNPLFDDVLPKVQKTQQEILRLLSIAPKKPIPVEEEMDVSSSFAFDFSQGIHAPATLLDSAAMMVCNALVTFRKAVGSLSDVLTSFRSPAVRTSSHQTYDSLNVDHLSVNENFVDNGRYPNKLEDIKSMQKDWRKFETLMAAFIRAYLPESDISPGRQ